MSDPASPLILIVSPAINAKGMRATSVRGQLFDARLDGRLVVGRSTQPMLDAARALLAEGIDPATPLVMQHAGTDAAALRSTVGAAGGLTVRDTSSTGKPAFGLWRPFKPSAVTASMHQNEIGRTAAAGERGTAPVAAPAMAAAG